MSGRLGRISWRISIALAVAVLPAACQVADKPSGSQTPPPEQLATEAQAFVGRRIADLIADAGAMALGERLFEVHCAACHGSEAAQRDVPDLRRGAFNYGATEEAVRTTIAQGRISVMPDMGHNLGEVDLGQLVAFVQSLSFESPLSSYAERGKMLFAANCAKCHGADGLGDPELGAPSLADDYWQHGNSMMNIRMVITRGVQAQCPGYAGSPTAGEIELLTAYVLKLSGSGG